MNWEAIVAISQLVAAIGVILSLIFLAIQLRQNTKAVRSSSIHDLTYSLSATAQTVVENENIVQILLKAKAGPESLNEEERARLHYWLVMAFRRFEGVYFQRTLGLVDSTMVEGFERSFISMVASKSGRAWWSTAKGVFSSGFVSYVDEQIQKGVPKTLHPGFDVES